MDGRGFSSLEILTEGILPYPCSLLPVHWKSFQEARPQEYNIRDFQLSPDQLFDIVTRVKDCYPL